MMHALVGEGEGEADAEGARAVDARVAGAGVGGAVADAARVVCAPAAGATGMTTTGPADGTDATRGTTMGGIMQVDAPRPQNGAGAVAAGAPGAAGSGGSGAARAAKYNMATLEERTRFKLRCEVLMLEIKDRNHKGRQGAYSADDHARNSFLKRTALPGLRWGKVPGEHDQRMLFLGQLKTLSDESDKARLQAWVDAHSRARKRKSLLTDRLVQRSILEWASNNTNEIVPTQPAIFGRPVTARFPCGEYKGYTLDAMITDGRRKQLVKGARMEAGAKVHWLTTELPDKRDREYQWNFPKDLTLLAALWDIADKGTSVTGISRAKDGPLDMQWPLTLYDKYCKSFFDRGEDGEDPYAADDDAPGDEAGSAERDTFYSEPDPVFASSNKISDSQMRFFADVVQEMQTTNPYSTWDNMWRYPADPKCIGHFDQGDGDPEDWLRLPIFFFSPAEKFAYCGVKQPCARCGSASRRSAAPSRRNGTRST